MRAHIYEILQGFGFGGDMLRRFVFRNEPIPNIDVLVHFFAVIVRKCLDQFPRFDGKLLIAQFFSVYRIVKQGLIPKIQCKVGKIP